MSIHPEIGSRVRIRNEPAINGWEGVIVTPEEWMAERGPSNTWDVTSVAKNMAQHLHLFVLLDRVWRRVACRAIAIGIRDCEIIAPAVPTIPLDQHPGWNHLLGQYFPHYGYRE